MPDLFTSLQDFTQWFSRGIEDGTGRKNDMLQAQQLRRLHDVLRPFMLRRVKRNVQSELGEKIEKDILVNLSPRQHMMYKALRSNASIKAILDQAKETSDTSTKRNALMNVVMQFRKVHAVGDLFPNLLLTALPFQVCNHPELFERADVTAPLSFSTFSSSGDLLREQSLYLPDSCENPIRVQLPRIMWEEGGILRRPSEQGRAGFETRYLQNLMNIWSPDNLVTSFEESGK
jgi:DNA helicase INO80